MADASSRTGDRRDDVRGSATGGGAAGAGTGEAPPGAGILNGGGAQYSGEWVIIGLVVSLLAFMTITYGVAAYYLRGDDWLSLVAPYARLTNSAFFGLAAFCGVDAYRKGRTGWWLYVGGGLIPLLQWFVVVYWMVAGRKRAGRFLKWTI